MRVSKNVVLVDVDDDYHDFGYINIEDVVDNSRIDETVEIIVSLDSIVVLIGIGSNYDVRVVVSIEPLFSGNDLNYEPLVLIGEIVSAVISLIKEGNNHILAVRKRVITDSKSKNSRKRIFWILFRRRERDQVKIFVFAFNNIVR